MTRTRLICLDYYSDDARVVVHCAAATTANVRRGADRSVAIASNLFAYIEMTTTLSPFASVLACTVHCRCRRIVMPQSYRLWPVPLVSQLVATRSQTTRSVLSRPIQFPLTLLAPFVIQMILAQCGNLSRRWLIDLAKSSNGVCFASHFGSQCCFTKGTR